MRKPMPRLNPKRRQDHSPCSALEFPLSLDRLQSYWRELACRYFDNRLPPIPIEWSSRLTASAGLFVSLVGPRMHRRGSLHSNERNRLIRLSLPLLAHQPEREIIRTLAHEMIHQWQYDIRRSRPSHGRDFRDKMEELNQDGLGITIRHTLSREVEAFTRYVWRCLRCGIMYHRQRRTIFPQRHRCGYCHGLLAEETVHPTKLTMDPRWDVSTRRRSPADNAQMTSQTSKPLQLQFDFIGRSA